MKPWRQFIEPVSPYPLAVYRIAFTTVVLLEFLHFIARRDLYLLPHPLTDVIPAPIVVALTIWGLGILGTLIGFLTPLSALLMYRGIVVFFPPGGLFSYHADMLYVSASLLLIVLPCWRALSVDRWLARRAFGIDFAQHPIPRLFYLATPLYVMGFMYVDSTLYKLQSQFWLDGLGFWLPASFPSFTMFNWNAVLNWHWLMLAAGYITLLFEAVFIFVFWWQKARWPLVVIGLVLHVGIAVAFPIPLFGLLMVAMFVNFFPDASPAPQVTHQGLWRFDRAASRVLLVGLALAAVVQSAVTFGAISDRPTRRWLEGQIGITRHLVFGYWQFSVMSHEIAMVYQDASGRQVWIPWVKENGHAGWQGYGRPWSFWWTQSLNQDPELWARAAESWAKTEGLPLEQATVIVKGKDVRGPQQWERDRERQLEARPWQDLLTIQWDSHQQRQFSNRAGVE